MRKSVVVAAIALIACAQGAVAARATAAPAAARSYAVLVRFVRSGGLLGVHDELVVYRDGRAVSTRGHFRLTGRQLSALRDTLIRARFATLRRSYGHSCCDVFGYTITYRGRSVTIYQGATVPVRLRRALDLLNGLLFPRR